MKNLPYWLKGGIIAVFISIVFIVFSATIRESAFRSLKIVFGSTIDLIAMPVTLIFWGFICGDECPAFIISGPSAVMISICFWFLIGAIIGLIYGKIKKHN